MRARDLTHDDNIKQTTKSHEGQKGLQLPTHLNPLRIYTKWRSHGETRAYRGPYCRNPHSFCRQRKVVGLSAKPLHSRLLVTIIMQKKCIDSNVSFDIKESEAFGYLSSG